MSYAFDSIWLDGHNYESIIEHGAKTENFLEGLAEGDFFMVWEDE